MEEIVNKVANSALVVFDLEDYYQSGTRITIDISQWLEEGFLLREKQFRAVLLDHDWSQYKGCYVALQCSTDAIVPAWAMILITTYLSGIAKKMVQGNLELLENSIYEEQLGAVDFSVYRDKATILKGCSKKPVPENAYIIAIQKLKPFARSIMFGEACSAVPLFKRQK